MQSLLLEGAAPEHMQSAEATLDSQSSEDASTSEPLRWPAANAGAADGGELTTSGHQAEQLTQQGARVAELEGAVMVRPLLLLRHSCKLAGVCKRRLHACNVQALREKVKKLEQLVRLKDAKIQALLARPEAASTQLSSSWAVDHSWEQPPAA